MSRRYRKSGMSNEYTQDPGKDLFAYLFILIMVFSFMLLMTMEERHKQIQGQKGPQRDYIQNDSNIVTTSDEKIGRLVKENGKIYILFGQARYNPREVKDLDLLEKEERISLMSGKDGNKKKIIYIEEVKDNNVYLNEYLNAFQYLSAKGISVAFAERK